MAEVAGFPYFGICSSTSRAGSSTRTSSSRRSRSSVRAITDLFLISHGWNNDMADARALYRELLAACAT